MISIPIPHSQGVVYFEAFYLLAVFAGIAGAFFIARRKRIPLSELSFIIGFGVLMLLIGSKLVLFDRSQWQSFFTDFVLPEQRGKSVLGAIIGGMLGVFIAGKIADRKESMLDLFAVSFPVGMAIQRIGCLLSGCCHGTITSMPWGVVYGRESHAYVEQRMLGLIPSSATHALAVLPDQLFHVIACLIIAFIVWKMQNRFSRNHSAFLFSISLYLGFRFFEEFSRFTFDPQIWMGLKAVQWKVLLMLTLLITVIWIREKRASMVFGKNNLVLNRPSTSEMKLFLMTILTIYVAVKLGDWFTGDERMIVTLTVFPLNLFVFFKFICQKVITQKVLKPLSTAIIVMALMSQSANTTDEIPKSYTTLSVQSVLGRYYIDRKFNNTYHSYTDCFGNSYEYYTSDKIRYRSAYSTFGAGISRTKFYSKHQSTYVGLNLYAGSLTEGPLVSSTAYPKWNKTAFGINPFAQFDGRWVGIGVGGSLGMLGLDNDSRSDQETNYDVKYGIRRAELQFRFRVLDERYAFLEAMTGYDFGSIGQRTLQLLIGSRFNSRKYLLEIGKGFSSGSGHYFIVKGETPLTKKLYLAPQFMVGMNGEGYNSSLRFGFDLQYRFYDVK